MPGTAWAIKGGTHGYEVDLAKIKNIEGELTSSLSIAGPVRRALHLDPADLLRQE